MLQVSNVQGFKIEKIKHMNQVSFNNNYDISYFILMLSLHFDVDLIYICGFFKLYFILNSTYYLKLSYSERIFNFDIYLFIIELTSCNE